MFEDINIENPFAGILIDPDYTNQDQPIDWNASMFEKSWGEPLVTAAEAQPLWVKLVKAEEITGIDWPGYEAQKKRSDQTKVVDDRGAGKTARISGSLK